MKFLKRFSTALLVICTVFFSNAQSIDCTSDFWTITFDGHIQQWSLNNGAVSGGDTILSGGGSSICYSGNSNAPTFFSNNFTAPYTGFTYYDASTGWTNIPTTSLPVNNNGGYLNDQYYMVEGGFIQILKHWDGSNLITVDSLHLNGDFFAGTQDIAVDTAGHAWIFTGSLPSNVDSLKVFDKFGQIGAYDLNFSANGYGSFFLNDTLYIGTDQDLIYPVILNGGAAQLGTGIAFPTSNYTDMASCQYTASTNSISENSFTAFKVFPNPTNGEFSIDLGEFNQKIKISITDLGGRLIEENEFENNQLLNLKLEEPAGVYLLTIESETEKVIFRLIKE